MPDSDILVIKREEHHYWKTCPCTICKFEREKVEKSTPHQRHIIKISPENARILGYVK